MAESQELTDAIADALANIKCASILGVRGASCVIECQAIVVRNAAYFPMAALFDPYPEKVTKTRRKDNQEWFGFGLFFAINATTPCYEEIYLSYPKGEIALRRPVKGQKRGFMKLLITDVDYLDDVHALDGCIEGIDMINEDWSNAGIPIIVTS
jgi:hypothetical protein